MSNSTIISVRIPDRLLIEIDCLAAKKYKSNRGTPERTSVVLAALESYFNNSKAETDNSKLENAGQYISYAEFNSLKTMFSRLSITVEEIQAKKSLQIAKFDRTSVDYDDFIIPRIVEAAYKLLETNERFDLQDICQACNLSDSVVRNRLTGLVNTGKLIDIPGSGRRPTYYLLPPTDNLESKCN